MSATGWGCKIPRRCNASSAVSGVLCLGEPSVLGSPPYVLGNSTTSRTSQPWGILRYKKSSALGDSSNPGDFHHYLTSLALSPREPLSLIPGTSSSRELPPPSREFPTLSPSPGYSVTYLEARTQLTALTIISSLQSTSLSIYPPQPQELLALPYVPP